MASSINGNGSTSPVEPPHFVLVHGIGGGAWCWYKIKCLLENSCGYKVTCLDLTGSGNDHTAPHSILTFQHYNEPLVDFLSSLPTNHQVIVVGHSAGGLSVSDAIHRFGCNKIKAAVYVAATMLKFGFVTPHDFAIGVPDIYKSKKPEEIQETNVNSKDHEEFKRKAITQLCSLEDRTLASILTRPAPFQALATAKFEECNHSTADKVPRIYIKTTYDNVVKPDQQDAMIEKWPPSNVYEVESDHMPMFSAHIFLSGLLHKVALSYGY